MGSWLRRILVTKGGRRRHFVQLMLIIFDDGNADIRAGDLHCTARTEPRSGSSKLSAKVIAQ
jgi:hypothetical protein